MNKVYYIYHIPDFVWNDGSKGKIGATCDLENRVKRNKYLSLKPFSKYEILEEHTCKYKVSKREIELQKQYGYKIDSKPYYETINISNDKSRKKGGLNAVKTNKKNGHLKKLLVLGGKASGNKHIKTGHLKKMTKLAKIKISKPVIQYDLNGNFIKEFKSITDASNNIGLSLTSISKVCRGLQKSTKGYIFEYKNK